MKRKELENKFIEDIKKRGRVKRLLLAIDQFFNVLIWNGSQDETISSHIGRKIRDNRANRVEKWICSLLQELEAGHCKKSLGE